MLAIPALTPQIGADLNFGQAELGALTTIPVLMLSLGAIPGAIFIARAGPLSALVASLVLLAIASASRGLAPPVMLIFLGSVMTGFAIAVMQPALPALVLRWSPGYAALASAVYMNGMLMGEFIGAGFTLPLLMPVTGGSWRLALVVWSLPALGVAAAIATAHWRKWVPNAPASGAPSARPPSARPPSARPPWRDPRLWQLGVVMGAASAGYFGTNAYLPTVLQDQQQGERLAEYLFVFNGAQVVGSVTMVVLATRLVARRLPILLMSWLVVIAIVGVIFGSDWFTLVAAVTLGFATCVQLILVVALVPQIKDATTAAPYAAGIFAISYLLGFLMPLIGGIATDITGDTRLPLAACLVLAVVAAIVAHRAKQLTAREPA